MEDCALKVECVTEGRLRIWLTAEELQAWGVSYAQLGLSRLQTDRLLRQVMPAARRHLPSGQRRLSVEAIPVEGGCVLLVSGNNEVRPGGPILCRFAGLEELYALADRWHSTAQGNIATSLYELEEAYLLVIYPVEPLTASQQAMLREYCHRSAGGEAAAAYVGEHGRLLLAGNALEVLTGCENAPQEPRGLSH